jgi:hypothetical protein
MGPMAYLISLIARAYHLAVSKVWKYCTSVTLIIMLGSYSPRSKKYKDFQRFFLPAFKDFSKTFESN